MTQIELMRSDAVLAISEIHNNLLGPMTEPT